jgi:hypothetical protein
MSGQMHYHKETRTYQRTLSTIDYKIDIYNYYARKS